MILCVISPPEHTLLSALPNTRQLESLQIRLLFEKANHE